MKGLILWVLAAVGGAAAGAVGGAAWLAYSAPVVQEGVAPTEEGTDTVSDAGSSEAAAPIPGGSPLPSADSGALGGPSDVAAEVGEEPSVETRSGDGGAMPTPSLARPQASQPAEPAPFEPTESHQRLARIFAAMRPAEAAAVLGQLGDSEARGVLMAMPARNAAPILAELEPSRAASLSRLVLGGGSP